MSKQLKDDYSLHLFLIMKQDECKKPAAVLKAYAEGVEGLNRRLGKPMLSLNPKGNADAKA